MRHFKNTPLLKGLILSASSLVLAACGGGGGDGGGFPGGPTPADHIELRMSASRTSLPQNISMVRSSIGGPFTSSVTVEAIARNGNRYIPATGGEDFFACNVIQGIESVALYYHDGADEHMQEVETGELDASGNPIKVKVDNAYRSVTSGANSGAFTFHVTSENKAGTAVVRCAAQDPQSGKLASTEMTFTVGSNSQLPTSIRVRDSNSVDYNNSPRQPLYTTDMNAMNQLQVHVSVVDETGNPTPDPVNGAANIIAEILPASTATGGTLITSGQSGQRVVVRTINGIAQITVQAGTVPGALLVRFTGDALDNNVSNGVTYPIFQDIAIPVADEVVSKMRVLGVEPAEACQNKAYAGAVRYEGGYKNYDPFCTLAGGALPTGLTLAKSCSITGTPTQAGPSTFSVQVEQPVDPAIAGEYGLAKGDATITVVEAVKIEAAVGIKGTSPKDITGEDMNAHLTDKTGKAPFKWAVAAGACTGGGTWNIAPAIDAATGKFTAGTVQGAATDTCVATVTVTDDCGNDAKSEVTVTIE